jgi:hypothetical protein
MYELLHKDLESGAQSSSEPIVVSFFFHRRGDPLQRSVSGFYRSVLHQLLSRHETLLAWFAADTNFEQRNDVAGMPGEHNKWDWTESDLENRLEECIRNVLRGRAIRLYVDALDEVDSNRARSLWLYLRRLCGPKEAGLLSICISCRPYPNAISDPDYCITADHGNTADIGAYLHASFQAEERWRSRTDREEIEKMLQARASGVFQWVVLITAYVLESYGESKADILARICNVPTELGDLYEDMLKSVVRGRREDGVEALQFLRWITFASRPLSLTELRYAVATPSDVLLQSHKQRKQSRHWCVDNDTMAARVGRLSRGLVRVLPSAKGRVVEFDHESVKEYMIERGIRLLEIETEQEHGYQNLKGHTNVMMCKALICHLASEEASTVRAVAFPSKAPLVLYAVQYWTFHAVVAEDCGMSVSDLVDLTEWPSNEIWFRWDAMYHNDRTTQGGDHTTLQLLAAIYGLSSITKSLIAKSTAKPTEGRITRLMRLLSNEWNEVEEDNTPWYKDDIDAESEGWTPLSWAAARGHKAVVKALLDTGRVRPDGREYTWKTPLCRAAEGGHTAVVEILLATGKVSINGSPRKHGKPLQYAIDGGHEPVVKALLATGRVNLDSGELLELATARTYEAIVKMLQEYIPTARGCRNVCREK